MVDIPKYLYLFGYNLTILCIFTIYVKRMFTLFFVEYVFTLICMFTCSVPPFWKAGGILSGLALVALDYLLQDFCSSRYFH